MRRRLTCPHCSAQFDEPMSVLPSFDYQMLMSMIDLCLKAKKYLSPKDIANELGVSRSRAYEIVRECRRLVIGRSLRVTRETFDAWKRRKEELPDTPILVGRRRLAQERSARATAISSEQPSAASLKATQPGDRPKYPGRLGLRQRPNDDSRRK